MDAVAQNSRNVIRTGSKSFSAAARLFDPSVRESAELLYAWCRYCDDVIDGQSMGFPGSAAAQSSPRERLDRLYAQTQSAISGEPQSDPNFAALQRVAARHGIPECYPLELLEGFAMDVEGRTYESIGDTLLYCYHVAGVVGVMMAMIMGVRDEETLKRACDLGIAFQLTNIARDVRDDADMGRLYLPSQWLTEAGVPREEVGLPKHWPAVFPVVRRMLREAEPYYASARLGFRRLPFRSAWAIATASGVYGDIGRVLLARGSDAWSTRVSTSRSRKLYRLFIGAAQASFACTVERLLSEPPRVGLWTKAGLGG